jgi:ubiquinone/menaquinone biosynthesis C-methylase UbiE
MSNTSPVALEAPAAERNKDSILDVLERVLPHAGTVLEIASGTGQHVVHFARRLTALTWQPSDADPAMLESIEAHRAHTSLANVERPVKLDVLNADWPPARANAVICSNMIHIAPWAATPALFNGAARVLERTNPLVLYGPFRRNGRHTAASNEAFDASLKARNADWSVRDLEQDVVPVAARAEFTLSEVVPMPANNFCVVFRRN